MLANKIATDSNFPYFPQVKPFSHELNFSQIYRIIARIHIEKSERGKRQGERKINKTFSIRK